MGMRVGVDIGGTFIDFCALETGTSRVETLKVLTTPDDPGGELMEGLGLLEARHGLDPGDVVELRSRHDGRHQHRHPAQGRAARAPHQCRLRGRDRTGAAAHARDVLAVLRRGRTALIPRDLRLRRSRPHAGRWIGRDAARRGRSLAAVADAARAKGADGIVISFLHAYRNPAHEAPPRRGDRRASRPTSSSSASSEVWPVIREYERTTTAHHQRLRPSPGGRLSLVAGAEAWRARGAGPAHADQVQRRHHDAPSRASTPASVCCCRARPRASWARPSRRRLRRSRTCITLDIGGTWPTSR